MASRKPARTESTRQQQRPAARGSGAAQRSKSSGNQGAAGKSRVPANRPGGNGSGSASAVGRPAARGATASQPAAPAAKGPFGRLVAPLRSMDWLPLATLVLSLYGLGASIYLTIAHYDTNIRLACSDNGLVNCQAVTSSSESVVFGIFPVAVLGLAFFVFMVAINSPWGWRLSEAQPVVRWGRLGSVIVGMGFVIYLIYAELIQINAICLWCTTVHVATFLIFVLVVFHTSFAGSSDAPAARR